MTDENQILLNRKTRRMLKLKSTPLNFSKALELHYKVKRLEKLGKLKRQENVNALINEAQALGMYEESKDDSNSNN